MSLRAGTTVDVAVLGAGPAGSACALALAQAGIGRVCLVAGGRVAKAAAVGETIPPDIRLLLDRLGLWEGFLAERHLPCLGSCSSWGGDALGFNDSLFNPHGCGWHLDRARFDAFLLRAVRVAGVTVLDDARLRDGQAEGGQGYRLDLGADRLVARFVVDATGRNAAFARRLGARRLPLDRLAFVYGYFDATEAVSQSRLTLLEAVRDGWWYAAALPGRRLAAAFAADTDEVRAAGLTQDARWLGAALRTRHLAQRLEGCRFLAGSLVPRTVTSFRLDRLAGPRWLAIGDAAACFDPLAAQGIHKAIADGLDAVERIAGALWRGEDPQPAHEAALAARFDEYLVNRNHFYGLEQRWAEAPFWRRRQTRRAIATAA